MPTTKEPRTRVRRSVEPRLARKKYAREHGITRRGPRGPGLASVRPDGDGDELEQPETELERQKTDPPPPYGRED